MQDQTQAKIERISVTIDTDLLNALDKYVDLQKTVNSGTNRSSVIRDLVKVHIPV